MLINAVFLIAWLYMAYLFFSKRRTFPKWYISLAFTSAGIIVLDTIASKIIMPNLPILDPATAKSLLRILVMLGIWVPYMKLSKRVEATFIH